MKKTSQTRPQTLEPGQYGTYSFNWNIAEIEGGYVFESVDVIGELTRANIKMAMMLKRYTQEEITEYENAYADNPKTKDLGVKAYRAVKAWVEEIITNELGPEE